MSPNGDPALQLAEGWIDPELAEEFPELHLTHAAVEAAAGPSPARLKRRLRELADRYTGAKVVQMRQSPVPWAYRVFSRQVGIDPDVQRPPAEQVGLERLKHGGLRSRSLVDDALTIAVGETGVPVIALDADLVGSELGLRLARSGERLGPVRPLSDRQIVVADRERPVAVVLGEIAEDAGVTPATKRMLIAALQVKGVPRISVEEALWLTGEILLDP
jgi:DNA/RNA-binding domain of Phe-tRNA-synthetase-like protein